MEPAFSRRGEPATPFERELLSSAPVGEPTNAQQLWLVIARRIGMDELMVMLDEFGDAHVWVPTRSRLVQNLWGDVRDAEICRLRDVHGMSLTSIAKRMQVSRTTVGRVVRARHGGGPQQRAIHGR